MELNRNGIKGNGMRARVVLLSALVVGVLGLPTALAPPGASALVGAPETHTVQVSAEHPERDTFHFTAFYPDHLQVHPGDTVQWNFLDSYAGWHSVTFAPSDMDVATHPEPRYPTELGDDWGVEESGLIKIPDYLALGSPDGFFGEECGRGAIASLALPSQEPCVLSSTDKSVGSSVSDTFFAMNNEDDKTFSLTIDENLPTGAYRYHCLLHPSMVGEVEVVPPTKELDRYTVEEHAADLAADIAAAEALAVEFEDPAKAYDPLTGQWTVHVTEATDDGRVSIMEFLPSNINVKPGDTVRYVAATSPAGSAEPNTVTFPAEAGGGFCLEGGPTACQRVRVAGVRPLGGTAFLWGCDADDLNAGLPMVPLVWTALRDCPDGSKLEWTLQPYMSHPQAAPDDAVLSPATFHNSGILIPAKNPPAYRNRGDGTQFPHEFVANFPTPGTFTYKCLGHPDFMAGTVTVTP